MAKEIPYSKIDPREMEELEVEFGRALTPELAQCLIRYRINRDAIELMLRNASAPGGASAITPKLASKSEDLNEDTEGELRSRQPGARRAARKAVA